MKLFSIGAALLGVLLLSGCGGGNPYRSQHVSGYHNYRGTYVAPYYRAPARRW